MARVRDTASVDGDVQQLVGAAMVRTRRIVDGLSALGVDELRQPSLLPQWSRLTIACHLRYGAEALSRMTRSALDAVPVAYYPEGRNEQRPRTLAPEWGESPDDVVASLAQRSDELNEQWSALDPVAWRVEVAEPPGNIDLGPIRLGRLPLLRLTEVEVHGTDLAMHLEDWSEIFVEAALPMRLEWLNVRRANDQVSDRTLEGSWLLVATDGATYKVSVDGTTIESRPAARDEQATAVIEASSRDLLALLLGRPLRTAPVITGDIAFGRSFSKAFPGP